MTEKELDTIEKEWTQGGMVFTDFIAYAREHIPELIAECRRLNRERNMAVADLSKGKCCSTCKHLKTNSRKRPCKSCDTADGLSNWEWRGVRDGKDEEVENGQ